MHSGRLFSPLRSIFQHFLAVLVIYGTVELAVSFSTRERCAGAIFVAILKAQRLRRFLWRFSVIETKNFEAAQSAAEAITITITSSTPAPRSIKHCAYNKVYRMKEYTKGDGNSVRYLLRYFETRSYRWSADLTMNYEQFYVSCGHD